MPIKRVSRRHSIANFGGYEADALPQPLPQMPPQPYAAAPYGSPLPQPQQQQQPQQPQAPPQQYQPAPPMPAPSPPPQLLQQPASGLSVDERTAAAAAMGAEFAHLRQLSVVEQLTVP
jgi:pyruvate/2-oxoglutarate dehydrogenase complex dihydrolipoamide acyltransferase (E2) component